MSLTFEIFLSLRPKNITRILQDLAVETKESISRDKKIGRLRRPFGLGTCPPLRILDDFSPGPESEFDLAKLLKSFFVSRDKKVFHII